MCLVMVKTEIIHCLSCIKVVGAGEYEAKRSGVLLCSQIHFHQIRAHLQTKQGRSPPYLRVWVYVYN